MTDSVREISRSQRMLAAFWIAAGLNHFRVPAAYESIVPDRLPAPGPLVFWSGVAELAGGLAVLSERSRNPFARWWLLGVLAAVYPANLHMALHPDRYRQIPPWALWARLPLQFLAAWWVWRATRR
jgi:uncharacterized membrane protein